ncbi:class I SAM-dependent methyltransferase [bacterium SCSIO 12696]|nr:class I SAM-dependent methyltransferase [bacterium SCSIO 12696]
MKVSSLLKKIEELQGDTPWGHVLDAGTGPKSLSWISRLPSQSWTAVTAQSSMVESARGALQVPPRETDRIVLGNWVDGSLLEGERFDTVLLDYFIGSIDAFAPYSQEALLHRIAASVRGTLYITGLEPYVPVVVDEEVGSFVGDLARLRDACMLLARDRPYREYPSSWVAAQLRQIGFTVTHTKYFSIRYRHRFLSSQLQICEDRVTRFTDPDLAAAMGKHIAQMRHRGELLIERNDGLRYGRDYLIRAVPG